MCECRLKFKINCKNYRKFSWMRVLGKMYRRILIVLVKEITDGIIDKKEFGFRTGLGCVDQVFVLRQAF